jgi:D-threo-aldose 1-dehydrogenase
VVRAIREARLQGRSPTIALVAATARMARRRITSLASLGGSAGIEPDASATPGSTIRPRSIAVVDYSAAAIRESVEGSLERLGRHDVDLVYLHNPEAVPPSHVRTAWRVLTNLRDGGVIGAIGVASDDAGVATRCLEELRPSVAMIAGRYTLLDRSAGERLLPTATRLGIPVIAAGVFNSGILADPAGAPWFDYKPAPTPILRRAMALAEACERHGVPLRAAAIQFPLRHPAIRAILVGVRDSDQVRENVDAFERDIPPDLWTQLGFHADPG